MSKIRIYAVIAPLRNTGAKVSAFTYHSDEQLTIGQIVTIPLRAKKSFGIVLSLTGKPSFATKGIISTTSLPSYPRELLELANWLAEYYATPLNRVLQTMIPATPYVNRHSGIREPAHAQVQKTSSIKLSRAQTLAIERISNSNEQNFLLHGATGSGKTEVYLRLAKANIRAKKSCIILVPEIALTPQLESQFVNHFPGKTLVTHSRLTEAQRRKIWQQCLTTKNPIIIIGPRSALFLPVPNLGLIVIDEAHEQTYKQEQAPRYQTTSVAAKLAHLAKAKLVMGTATPLAQDIFLANAKRLELVEMPKPIFERSSAKIELVDLRNKELSGPNSFISKPLLSALKNTLSRDKQAILFINRRGSARLAICSNCSWSATCPNCHIPLTLHADTGILLCHWCDYSSPPPSTCPDCGRMEIRFLGGGTKRIESEIKRLLPQARVARLDKDSFNADTIHRLFDDLNNGKIDILIGTQMIAKGLDVPNVEMIGVVLADTMLYMPDYVAAERTYQLLHQVSGRAGRRKGSRAHVVIQTYSPEHPAIQASVKSTYKNFIESELKDRNSLNYPPYVYLLKIEHTRKTREAAKNGTEKLASTLSKGKGIQVVGPAPSFHETMRGTYRWQLIVKAKVRHKLVEIAKDLPVGFTHDLDPSNLL